MEGREGTAVPGRSWQGRSVGARGAEEAAGAVGAPGKMVDRWSCSDREMRGRGALPCGTASPLLGTSSPRRPSSPVSRETPPTHGDPGERVTVGPRPGKGFLLWGSCESPDSPHGLGARLSREGSLRGAEAAEMRCREPAQADFWQGPGPEQRGRSGEGPGKPWGPSALGVPVRRRGHLPRGWPGEALTWLSP